jgi:phage tail P2-like protein
MTSILPPNATKAERALEAAAARLGDVPMPARDYWNPATCPVGFLPWLAWAVSVDVWDDSWPEAAKRAAIAKSIPLHRRKGTVRAVELSIEPLGLDASIQEWWQMVPVGERGTFKVRIRPSAGTPPITLPLLRSVQQAIDRARPISRAFGLTLILDPQADVFAGVTCRQQMRMRVQPHNP